jgi:pSer/pThr/pTyr-binding forkhead associated (FHA) protein
MSQASQVGEAAMKSVTFQVLEGIDKGRVFRDLPVPVTIGREEGNILRLNDERVSRYHAKIQLDAEDVILTDLESTNGTRVNGAPVQIRRLKPGDQVTIGRSTLLFGSHAQISLRKAGIKSNSQQTAVPVEKTLGDPIEEAPDDSRESVSLTALKSEQTEWQPRDVDLPPLPNKLTPAQAARIAEILDYLHQGLSSACENIQANDDGTQVQIPFAEWQKIQAVQLLLARYLRGVAEPETMVE